MPSVPSSHAPFRTISAALRGMIYMALWWLAFRRLTHPIYHLLIRHSSAVASAFALAHRGQPTQLLQWVNDVVLLSLAAVIAAAMIATERRLPRSSVIVTYARRCNLTGADPLARGYVFGLRRFVHQHARGRNACPSRVNDPRASAGAAASGPPWPLLHVSDGQHGGFHGGVYLSLIWLAGLVGRTRILAGCSDYLACLRCNAHLRRRHVGRSSRRDSVWYLPVCRRSAHRQHRSCSGLALRVGFQPGCNFWRH